MAALFMKAAIAGGCTVTVTMTMAMATSMAMSMIMTMRMISILAVRTIVMLAVDCFAAATVR